MSIIEKILKKTCDEELKNFIKIFYSYVVDEYQDKVDILFSIAKDLYDLTKSRAANENKVRVFKPIGWEDNLTVIEVITEDKPFLVDSVTEELKHRGYIIYDRINSVIPRFINNKKVMESVIYFSVTSMSQEEMEELEFILLKILKMVGCCVCDWRNMLTKVDLIAEEIEGNTHIVEEVRKEIIAFLNWLKKGNFVFLGYAEYKWKKNTIARNESTALGAPKIDTALYDLEICREEKTPIYITRSDRISKVHRHVNMDYIGIRRYDDAGKIVGEVRFLGLLTSIVYYQDVRLIPIIRKKIQVVENWAKFSKDSHDHKLLISVLQDFPRAELLHIPEKELFISCMGIIALSVREELKLFIHVDKIGKFVRCIIFIPRNKFSTVLWLRMQKLLAHTFDGKVANEQIRDSGLVRLQLILKVKSIKESINVQEIESSLKKMALGWEDSLKSVLNNEYDISTADIFYRIYRNAFPVSYQETFEAKSAFYDIKVLEKVKESGEVESNLYSTGNNHYQLKIYVPNKLIELFDMLPVIENMGMQITNHYSYTITLDKEFEILLHNFILSIGVKIVLPLNDVKKKFEQILRKVWKKEVENDYYNSLVLTVGLNWREVSLLRAFGHYLKQIRFNYTESFIQQALLKHSKIVLLLVKSFHTKFDPKLFKDSETRSKEVKKISNFLEELLGDIESLAEDNIIRALIEVDNAILRTNYYHNKNYLSFKINSQKIQNLPLPKPFVEIYVYSNEFEAIHLRGGMIARGGLRWSDRTEDFRTEVLGLMKAQMTKNTVIVPVGSKGGFIVKTKQNDYNNVIDCYKNFLRAMLDITDNIENKMIKHPENVIMYDNDDPYLVVAADKGTATFSDCANSVAQEYEFWLGDAFASGGSSGYDHKAMSITSRGAWIAAQNHLWVLGHKGDLTMVGVGDMSGDVFGNGLLLLKKIKLLMAFNHMHIFIDPDPDLASSFTERERLFHLKKSTWMDYNKELISKGGGVFSKSSKFIKMSPEMKKAFDIKEDKLSPDSLIVKGLKAKVDIIWNGGIGTFVKSSKESHDVVGDKSNDTIRINGKEVRAKMIIEGGNLGCTQLGRIEYAKNGGYINTDFIDNSAGVTCSDMEVNIKVALSKAIEKEKITIQQRNTLLHNMQEEVAEIILHNTNLMQARSLIFAKMESKTRLEQYHRLVKSLEKENRLSRAVEFIPNDEDFSNMGSKKGSLSVPELAVIISYAKMGLYHTLLSSEVLNDEYLSKYLIEYFPNLMREKFYNEVMEHRLRREITTTQIVNSIINRMGCTFIPNLVEYTGVPTSELIRIYISVYQAYNLDLIWKMVDALQANVSTYLETVREIVKFIEGAVHWFIRNHHQMINISSIIEEFKESIETITQNISQILDEKSGDAYNQKLNKLLDAGLSQELSASVANLEFLPSALPIIRITKNIEKQGKVKIPLLIIANIYFKLGRCLQFNWLKETTLKLNCTDYWKRLSIEALFDDLQDQQMNITEQVGQQVDDLEHYAGAVDKWCIIHRNSLTSYNNMLNDIKALKELDLSRLIIIIKCLTKIR